MQGIAPCKSLPSRRRISPSDSLGLSIQFRDDVAIGISAKREFTFSGRNLVGMPAAQAIMLAGGETGRDAGEPIDFVQTACGLEIYEEAGRVLMVSL